MRHIDNPELGISEPQTSLISRRFCGSGICWGVLTMWQLASPGRTGSYSALYGPMGEVTRVTSSTSSVRGEPRSPVPPEGDGNETPPLEEGVSKTSWTYPTTRSPFLWPFLNVHCKVTDVYPTFLHCLSFHTLWNTSHSPSCPHPSEDVTSTGTWIFVLVHCWVPVLRAWNMTGA